MRGAALCQTDGHPRKMKTVLNKSNGTLILLPVYIPLSNFLHKWGDLWSWWTGLSKMKQQQILVDRNNWTTSGRKKPTEISEIFGNGNVSVSNDMTWPLNLVRSVWGLSLSGTQSFSLCSLSLLTLLSSRAAPNSKVCYRFSHSWPDDILSDLPYDSRIWEGSDALPKMSGRQNGQKLSEKLHWRTFTYHGQDGKLRIACL